jgi:NADH-quinone oxidoreductase subunit F
MSFPKILTANWGVPDSHHINVAMSRGAYETARAVLGGARSPDDVTAEVKKSGLRGRGGAGFPTGMKWGFLPKGDPRPRYLVINADESEPGTYKDRRIIENDPHMLIEGCILASYAIGAHDCYIYVRGEFWSQQSVLRQAVQEAYNKGFLGARCFGTDFKLDITVHSGAGSYICGEESALLTSLVGDRG